MSDLDSKFFNFDVMRLVLALVLADRLPGVGVGRGEADLPCAGEALGVL